MSHLNPGLISAYNSLTDKHLAGYFSNTRIRRHLQRAGLITRSGRIVPDKEYRHKLIQRHHQRHIRECLAQAIFHKVLEMERVHQIEIKRRLEEFARRERVHKIKVERSRRYEEDTIPVLSPRPPTGARFFRKQHSGPEGEHSESSESPGSSRPNTAPGKMQRPVRLKPIHRRSSPYRRLESSNENEQPFNHSMESRRRLTRMETSGGISPYCLPVINNFVTPVPPATKRKDRGVKVAPSGLVRGRRLRTTTSFSGADVSEEPPMLRSSVHQSRVSVNMTYFGKTVHLSHDLSGMKDEVKVFQQHCGGENLCVYKGMLHEGETFHFISRRHRGFPFSLTFFLNGLQVERLSSCCEFKHRKGSRLGGKNGHFGFCSVEGASPCYKCIIAMGLDKKPTPPPKRVRENRPRDLISPKDSPEVKAKMTGEDEASHSENESSRPQEVETPVREETAAEEDKARQDYEEDFEADDEGPADDAEEKEKKSPSPFSESQGQVKEGDAFETEDDEKDEDMKSCSSSSSSGSDREESDAEADKESREDEKAERPPETDQEEAVAPPQETDAMNPEEATEAESAAAKDSDIQNSAADSTDIDISDTSVPSGNENKQSDDTSGDNEVEKTVVESKQEQEQERAKSVQEKLAEAILKEAQCSSEPELSDTSTEEEEESAHKEPGQADNNAFPEEPVRRSEQQQNLTEEAKCEEGDHEGKVMVQDEEETSDPREPEDKPPQSGDEKVRTDETDEVTASEENTADNNKPEDTDHTRRHPEEMDDEISDPQQDAAAEPMAAAGEDEEKTVEEADPQPEEMGQVAKSNEQDESSASEPNQGADEAEVLENAEAETMTASQTVEMKAEPSEEQEALNCEEAPVTDTEGRQLPDHQDRAAAAETEVTAETSSSSLEESGDAAAEQRAGTSGNNANGEDDVKKEEAEGLTAGEAREEGQQERCHVGDEETEKSVETDEKEEEHPEEDSGGQEKQTSPEAITESDKSEERVDNNETKTETMVGEEENIADETHSGEDKVATEGKADDSEQTGREEGSECVMDENGKKEKDATSDGTNEAEQTSTINTAADKEKSDEAEQEEGDQNENKSEQSDAAENQVEEKEGGTGEGEAEELKRSTDKVKISDENIVESEGSGESEAANVVVTTAETQSNEMEAADEKTEAERGDGDIDAENGEISSRAENKTQDEEDEGEVQSEGKNGENAAEHTRDEAKDDEPARGEGTEVKASCEESRDGAEKHEDITVDQGPDTDVAEGEVKDEEESLEKQEEPAENNKEAEKPGPELPLEDMKETKCDENCNLSEIVHENGKNDKVQNNETEVKVASSSGQEQSSSLAAVDLDDTADKLDASTEPCKADKHPETDAVKGDSGDAEEASKASEEGASVLLKPQAQLSSVTHKEDSAAAGKEPPEALAAEDNRDLVSNWVTMHQASKFFETFVEPLDDLKESGTQETNLAPSADPPRPASPPQMPDNTEQELPPEDVNESKDRTKEEASESELEGDRSKEGEPCEGEPVEDILPAQEETEVANLMTEAESVKGGDVRSAECDGSRVSVEEEVKGPEVSNTEQTDLSKTEVESIAGSHHSVPDGRPESVSENQAELKTADNGLGFDDRQTTVEELTDLLPSCETEECHEQSAGPDGLPDLKAGEVEDTEDTLGEGGEVTEVRDFPQDRNEEESHHNETKASDGSISGDRQDRRLIQDIQPTLSKDRLSPFSVDETLFGRSCYPLLTAARTENGH